MLPTISEYEIVENIHKGTSADVYRGFRARDNLPVIIKITKDDPQYSYKLSQYQNHYEIVKEFEIDHIVKTYELKRHRGQTVMILEDFDGESVAKSMAEEKLSLEEKISLSIEAAAVLNTIHSHNIIHKDINSSNFIMNRTTGQMKITDFDFSTTLKQEASTYKEKNLIEGTVSYMSPEQTGRINRSLDYRTDFYSLGVTLYEWFTGRLPFEKEEALELIHCHIAKQPVPPHEQDAKIPKTISDIIMKLLEKSPEDRYQSAIGLQRDFEECYRQYLDKGTIKSFPLCQYDISVKFNIPEKLYGRSKELEILTDALEHLETGDAMCIFVSGSSGIGKTALIQEIRNSEIMEGGFFVQGKYDRFNQNIPFSAFNISFHSFIRQLLTGNEDSLKEWKKKILGALGPNGQIVLDILPELELIIGPQPNVPELPPRETQNRFNTVFVDFFSVFQAKGRPLVFFLDDIQWVDNASLQALERLLKLQKSRLKYFLFVGAYRDDEVDSSHPLMRSIERIRRENIALRKIRLEPLSQQDLNLMLSDTLHHSIDKTANFANLVFSKTGGNPFFVREFLKKIHEDNLIKFVEGWEWDLSRIREAYVTDNVVALMTNKIVRLPKATLEMMKTAACIGMISSLDILSIISEKSKEGILDALTIAIEEGIVVKIDDSIRFVHDRIKEAVYSLIDEADSKKLHYRIGKQLLSDYSFEKSRDTLFLIANQFNMAKELLNEEERNEVSKFNLKVGETASSSGAFESAEIYYSNGIGLLHQNSWLTDYELSFSLYLNKSKVAYLIGDFDTSEHLCYILFSKTTSLLDEAKICEIKILGCIAQRKMKEAISIAQEMLKKLGIKLPVKPTKFQIIRHYISIKSLLRKTETSKIYSLPEMTDPHKLAAMRILSHIISAAYLADPRLFPIIAFKEISLSLKYGNTPVSPYSFVSYGSFLCGVIGDIDSGYKYGKLALSLLDRMASKENKASSLFLYNACIHHLKNHVRDSFPGFMEAHRTGVETGDLEYACYAINVYSCYSFFAGRKLPELTQEMSQSSALMRFYNQNTALTFNLIFEQTIQNLLGQSDDTCRLLGQLYDERKMLQSHFNENEITAIFHVYLNKLILCYLFGDYRQADENVNKLGKKYLEGMPGFLNVSVFYFYSSLIKLALFNESPKSEQNRILKSVRENQKKLKKWAQHAPMNYLHKYHLVEAEIDRVTHKPDQATLTYDQAIELAQQNNYLHEEAIANELASKFWLSLENNQNAKRYMAEAYNCYKQWGAIAKLNDLKKRYPGLVKEIVKKHPPVSAQIRTAATSRFSDSLDLTTIVKATQALSSEIKLDKLLSKLMKITIENAGAEKGFLIQSKNGQLIIASSAADDFDNIEITQSIPIEKSNLLAASVAHYVNRTGKEVVLQDASHEGDFLKDPYIEKHQPKSILCMPVKHKEQSEGILYLENNLTTNAFTEDRLEVLYILLTQASISIENANLFEKQIIAEKELKESEERFRRFTENAKDMIYRMSVSKKSFEYVSPAATDLFGYSPEEFYANPNMIENIVPPDWVKYFKNAWESILLGNMPASYEYKVIHKSGDEKWIHQRNVLITDDGGRPVELECIATDITELKQSEEALKSLRNILSNIINSMPSVLIGVDSKGTITQWNMEAEKSTGIPEKQALGHPLTDALPQMELELLKVKETISTRVPQVEEKIVSEKDGEKTYSNITVYPLITNGVDGAVIRIDDITERVRIEEMMIQNEKMMSVGGLAAGMAHEINNPLAGILQNMQVIVNRMTDGLAKNKEVAEDCGITMEGLKSYMDKRDIFEMIDLVFKSGKRAAQIVDNMLSFSRKSESQFIRHDLGKLLDKTVELAENDYDLKKKYDFRKIEIIREYDGSVPTVPCDENKIQQVFLNILKNGAQEMAMNKSEDKPSRFVLRLKPERDMACIEIEDHGLGMDEMTQKRVFEPFFTTKSPGVGTGLGLSVSYFIITENHGGTMAVESEAGRGSTFIIRLPLDKTEQ